MPENPYLTNIIASKDIKELSIEGLNSSAAPNLLFSIEQLCGEHESVVVQAGALKYAAQSNIEDSNLFSDALIDYAHIGKEVFFEADYEEFIASFPFQPDDHVRRIGIQAIPSSDGVRFQTLTYLDTGELMHDPYYMFLPTTGIEAARGKTDASSYYHELFEAMTVEFPGSLPTPGSEMAQIVDASIPISATLATIGISLLALYGQCRFGEQAEFPVLQEDRDMPTIVSLDVA